MRSFRPIIMQSFAHWNINQIRNIRPSIWYSPIWLDESNNNWIRIWINPILEWNIFVPCMYTIGLCGAIFYRNLKLVRNYNWQCFQHGFDCASSCIMDNDAKMQTSQIIADLFIPLEFLFTDYHYYVRAPCTIHLCVDKLYINFNDYAVAFIHNIHDTIQLHLAL